ncbi:MAG: DNA repair protein RadC [Candidatus Paceibacterota bacterium]|jgi:DNA repair protein RadC
MKLKSLAKVDLPREKLQKYGVNKLQDHELLALLLGSGIKDLNVLQLSKKILTIITKLGADKITLENLLEIKGLGQAKASQIIAVIELGKRLHTNRSPEVLSAQDIWNLCADFRESKKEHFVAFYLDTQSRLIERQIISIGTLNNSLVHPREVFEPAIKLSAASVIIAHNHPSGSLEPSKEDKKVTERLKQSGELLGIEIIDHVILSKSGYLSFKHKNLL